MHVQKAVVIRKSQDVTPDLIRVANIMKILITGRQQLAAFVARSSDSAALSHLQSRRGATGGFRESQWMEACLMLPFVGVKVRFSQIAHFTEPQS